MATIGIPRGFFFDLYYPEWKVFFEALGFDVLPSPETNKVILDEGIKIGVSEACISLKLYEGHVAYLVKSGKVDYVFVPRLLSEYPPSAFTLCPKFRGLPDIVRAALLDMKLPDVVLTANGDWGKKNGRLEFYIKVGLVLGKSKWQVKKAFLESQKMRKKFMKLLLSGYLPTDIRRILLDGEDVPKPQFDGHLIGILGYPYLVYDEYITNHIFDRLRSEGFSYITADMYEWDELYSILKDLGKPLFWGQSNKVLAAAMKMLKDKRVEGLVSLESYGCGTDAWIGKIIEQEAKGIKPYMELILDEQTAEAGMVTRIEAFVDMIMWKEKMAKKGVM
ncbi:MAG: hypothetical protein J7L41_00460 [Synergistetes bacterium]|nr:hypothetical protein [Synergistota bacterium]